MKIYNIILLIIVFSQIFFSCIQEEIIEGDSINYHSKLVVYCILTPGDSVFASVTRSFPLSDTTRRISDSFVTDATVTIENKRGDYVELVNKDKELPIYGTSQSEFKIHPGEEYFLYVDAEGYPGVTAKTIVPENSYHWSEIEKFNIVIPYHEYIDIEGIEIKGYCKTNNNSTNKPLVVTRTKLEVFNDSTYSYFTTNYELSDIPVIGNHHVFSCQYPKYRFDVSTSCNFFHQCTASVGDTISALRQVELVLVTIDEHLSLFNQSSEIYSDIWFSSDVFLNQYRGIIPEYTNIDHGLGIFGSYLTDKYLITLK